MASRSARRSARPRGILLLALVVALLLPTTIAAEAVRWGKLNGPTLTLRLGSYYLIARTTEHPACVPLPEQCFIPRPSFRVPQPRYYTVWAGRIVYPAAQGGARSFAQISGRRVVQLETGQD